MKKYFLIVLFTFTIVSCKTSRMDLIFKTTCNCFDSIKYTGDKLQFQMAEQKAMMKLRNDILDVQKFYSEKSTTDLKKSIYDRLQKNCYAWNKVMAKFYELSTEKTPTKIQNKTDCNIMKGGHFLDLIDNSYFDIIDSVMTARSVDFYTKSKIKWIDSCSYKLSPFESTDPSILSNLDKNLVFTISIIEIKHDTIIYECELFNDYSLGQWIKKH